MEELIRTHYQNRSCVTCSNCDRCLSANPVSNDSLSSYKQDAIVDHSSTLEKVDKKKSAHHTGQCQALTKKGMRCKRKGSSRGYCWQHQP